MFNKLFEPKRLLHCLFCIVTRNESSTNKQCMKNAYTFTALSVMLVFSISLAAQDTGALISIVWTEKGRMPWKPG